MCKTLATVLLVYGLSLAPILLAQTFDAASIKESADTGNTGGGMRLLPNGDIRVQHMPARSLITIAHQIEGYQLAGEPEWTGTAYYDIVAKANAPTTREATFAMMRGLLAERFKLAFHREKRDVQGYALIRATDRLGTGLTPSTVNCEENFKGSRCSEGGITMNSFTAFGMPLASVIRIIATHMAPPAPIVDETGLTGTFDVALRWSNEATGSDDAPVISTALREQLGLRLERRQVPVEVLAVDHIEPPTPD
jgi:uncharacterized protein (TIGR03435 family)